MQFLFRKRDNSARLCSLILYGAMVFIAITIRLLLPFMGHNFDVESYKIVVDILSSGGNVYKETSRYNYGPLWFHMLYGINSFVHFFTVQPFVFESAVATFLTIVDCLIAAILWMRVGKIPALFFLLNPISIFITGYHRQFDNLAILFGLIAVLLLEEEREKKPGFMVAGTFCLGISLCIKHLLFLFPIWLLFRNKHYSLRTRLMLLVVPATMFLLSFVPYAMEGFEGIWKNVFQYKSTNNAPFWHTILMPVLKGGNLQELLYLPLFLVAMIAVGYKSRYLPLMHSLANYLITLVIFSSAVTNQYLVIPVLGIAILYPTGGSIYYLPYIIISSVWLYIVSYDGLGAFWNFPIPQHMVQGVMWYPLCMWALFYGFSYLWFSRLLKRYAIMRAMIRGR